MTSEFNQYRIYYQSAPQYNWDSQVLLYMNGRGVGRLTFMKAGQSIPANTMSGDFAEIHFPSGHFNNIMSMLREEKPLYVTLVPTNGIATISTSSEPVGEQEGV